MRWRGWKSRVLRSLSGPKDTPSVRSDFGNVASFAAAWHQFSQAVAVADLGRIEHELGAMRRLLEAVWDEGGGVSRVGQRNVICMYVDSLFLRRSWEFVVGTSSNPRRPRGEEVFHYAAGVVCGQRAYVITHLVPVLFSEQTATYVRVDEQSNGAALQSIDQWGLVLAGHFHCHPGRGPGATKPSGIDLSFQGRLQRGGHIAVGGIFSTDGYVRFFRCREADFKVVVVGNHAEEVARNVYKISLEARMLPVGDGVERW